MSKIFKPGDRVKIKSEWDIKFSLEAGYHDYLFFAVGMERYCDQEVTLVSKVTNKAHATSYRVWLVTGNTWMWHENWLHLLSSNFLSDEDFDI